MELSEKLKELAKDVYTDEPDGMGIVTRAAILALEEAASSLETEEVRCKHEAGIATKNKEAQIWRAKAIACRDKWQEIRAQIAALSGEKKEKS